MPSRDIRTTVILRIGESEEGYELFKKLNAFRKSKGWTWRHFFLVGAAEIVHDDNPLLTEEIADLLTMDKRSTKF